MKRPMFRVGGPTSGGTGITSGLETPRQNFKHGSPHYQDYVDMIPGAFKKRRTGLENQMGSIGPMAALQAISGGALEDVHSIGDIFKAFGKPEVLQSVMGGMGAKNKLQSSLDDVDLKEATTMATLLKPKNTKSAMRDQIALSNELTKLKNKKLEDPNIFANSAEIILIDKQIAKVLSGDTDTEQLLEIMGMVEDPSSRGEIRRIYEMLGIDPPESLSKKAEGGRINKQMGGGFDVAPEPQAVSQEQQIQPQGEDPFQILRKRLPPEISDEVVSLIAYNKAAFQDFANIQDQDDVDLFNQKYNVQLVVDMASR